jgi:cytoskeleton protein RodZ
MDESIATTLKEARVTKGLELSDIAEITHVRKEYLKALEEGRYQDLPEDIYSRNFLRLYAQAVGLEDGKLLDRYTRERRTALGITPDDPMHTAEVIRPDVATSSRPGGGWLITLLLLGALGGLLYFAYSRNLLKALFNPNANQTISTQPTLPEVTQPIEDELALSETSNNKTSDISNDGVNTSTETSTSPSTRTTATTSNTNPSETIETSTPEADTTGDEAANLSSETSDVEVSSTVANTSDDSRVNTADTSNATTSEENLTQPSPSSTSSTSAEVTEVRFTLITDPPGADASIDNYPFATRTPVFNAPISARESRVLRIDLDGYEPYTELIDVLEDTSMSVSLKPISEGPSTAQVPSAAPSNTPSTPNNQGINITIEAETWLEVYQSTRRSEGERLYYGTAQSGEILSYNLPVYVHVGNAAGVRIKENNRELGLMGSSGEVTGRAFGQSLPEAETAEETGATEEPLTSDEETTSDE